MVILYCWFQNTKANPSHEVYMVLHRELNKMISFTISFISLFHKIFQKTLLLVEKRLRGIKYAWPFVRGGVSQSGK